MDVRGQGGGLTWRGEPRRGRQRVLSDRSMRGSRRRKSRRRRRISCHADLWLKVKASASVSIMATWIQVAQTSQDVRPNSWWSLHREMVGQHERIVTYISQVPARAHGTINCLHTKITEDSDRIHAAKWAELAAKLTCQHEIQQSTHKLTSCKLVSTCCISC